MTDLLNPTTTSANGVHDVEEADSTKESCLEIPGRSVHPGKLTAMLRSNFGIGAYEIMV